MPTWQPQLLVLVASAVESLACLEQSFVQVSDRAKSNQRLAQAVACCRIRICVQAANVCAAKFHDNPSSHQPIPLMSFPAWLGQSIVQPMFVNNLHCRFSFDEPTAAQICAAHRKLRQLQPLHSRMFFQSLLKQR
jgi:hypothetical protein